MRNILTFAILGALAGSTSAQPTPEPSPPTQPAPEPEPGPTPTPTTEPAPIAEPEPVKPEVVVPVPPKEDKQPTGTAGYDKGFFIRSDDGKYSLTFTGRIQPFFVSTYTSDPKNFANAFEVRRTRLVFDGHLHTKKLLYKFQADYGKGAVTLKDAHFDLEVSKDVWLRFGQWKRPFSRQQITSSGRLETPDRAITDKAFGAGRDIGVAVGNRYEKSPDLEWAVGVFNGTGDGAKLEGITATVDPVTGEAVVDSSKAKFVNVPKEVLPVVVARVGINRNGIKGYSEADLEGGPLRYGVGASVQLEGDFDENDKSSQKLELDFIAKANGLSTTGGFYAQTDQKASAEPSVTDAELSLVGFHLQAGYMVVPKRWQVAARYAFVDDARSSDAQKPDQQEIQLAASFFGLGHDAKFAGGVKLVKNGDAGFEDNVVIELGANVGW